MFICGGPPMFPIGPIMGILKQISPKETKIIISTMYDIYDNIHLLLVTETEFEKPVFVSQHCKNILVSAHQKDVIPHLLMKLKEPVPEILFL
jgi:hypothetical protein